MSSRHDTNEYRRRAQECLDLARKISLESDGRLAEAAQLLEGAESLFAFLVVPRAAASSVQYRIMQNRPGPGWYWEVVEAREVVARGVADTHGEAVSQAAQVARRVPGEELQQSA